MPRYFIDLHDGTEFVRDTTGFDLPDTEAAGERAVRIMAKIAQGFQPDPGRQDYVAAARDADGRVVVRVRMSLEVEPIEPPHPRA
ncbi:DUF6894 family protein [Methylobacterium trifolii]|uniref:DUF6894 domain-containing protein n=1 Tax=Methylobacterium trifolii TaxID=1003092 RepID=A0ABQ4U4C6_9HYPH|nr:hypothetical protein [Methylobacterium trifolii]GJE62260.1 hypothetical protein MPOCJGCO_4392 [Methylobacterium trifolii]